MVERSSSRQSYIIIGLIGLIIVLLLTFIDFTAVLDLLLSADWRLVGASMIMLIFGYFLLNLRWRYLLRNQHSYRDLLKVTGSGYMYAILMQLPTSVYRIIVMDRKSLANVSDSSSAIAVEVVISLILRMIGAVLVVSLLLAR